MPEDTRDVTLAFLDLLVPAWDSTNTAGYGPAESGDHRLLFHTGDPGDRIAYPRVNITLVDETPESFGIAGDGSGYAMRYDSMVDIQCWAGTDDDLAPGDDPQDIAPAFAREAREIVHATDAIPPPTGEDYRYHSLVPGQIRPLDDPDAPPERVGITVEATCTVDEPPPNR